mmetsp:Transcript_42399/g.50877  ORF Transcript_42399/g.50877 Transcript_42399/m.50877 type:complete len:94 (-) Transcript_42399:23-304(-)
MACFFSSLLYIYVFMIMFTCITEAHILIMVYNNVYDASTAHVFYHVVPKSLGMNSLKIESMNDKPNFVLIAPCAKCCLHIKRCIKNDTNIDKL